MTAIVPTEATQRLRGLVAARSLADREGIALESVDADEGMMRGPDADHVAERLDRVLSPDVRPAEEIEEPVQYRRALQTLLGAARRAGEKLDADPQAPLTPVESMVFEAVVRTDGSRPSLLVRSGRVDADMVSDRFDSDSVSRIERSCGRNLSMVGQRGSDSECDERNIRYADTGRRKR